jgi:phenylalanyl-tRNA synthetase beta subunit
MRGRVTVSRELLRQAFGRNTKMTGEYPKCEVPAAEAVQQFHELAGTEDGHRKEADPPPESGGWSEGIRTIDMELADALRAAGHDLSAEEIDDMLEML